MEKPNTVKLDIDGPVVRIEVTTESDYEAIKLHDEFIADAYAKGEVTLTLAMLDRDGKPVAR
jgi:hypothetical protein